MSAPVHPDEQLGEIFDQYDADEVGYLDRVMFEQFIFELGRADLLPEQLERCFVVVDRDDDGRVTKEDFIKYVPHLYDVDFNPPPRRRKKSTTDLVRINMGPGLLRVGSSVSSTSSSSSSSTPLVSDVTTTMPLKSAAKAIITSDPATFFTKLKKLGKGSFGTVFKAIDVRSQEVIALKVVEIEGDDEVMEDVQREVTVMADCHSPFVVRYFGSYLRGTELWISMEYVSGGSVLDLLKFQSVSEAHARIIIRAVLNGLTYLHSENKLHRDIKAANILITDAGQVKLADFGVAASLYSTENNNNTFAGTPLWMAPEVIQQRPQTYAVDIWSLGITAIEIVKGSPPKSDLHPMQVLFSIPEDPAPRLEGGFSDDFKGFIAACLNKDPNRRPPAAVMLTHPFMEVEDEASLRLLLRRHQQLENTQWRLSRMSMAIDNEMNEIRASRSLASMFWDFSPDVANDEPDLVDMEEEAKEKFQPGMIDPSSELGIVLSRLHLLHLASIFKDNDVDLDAFLLLEDQDLRDMGVKLGNRKKLLHMIPILRRELGFTGLMVEDSVGIDGDATPTPSTPTKDSTREGFPAETSSEGEQVQAEEKEPPHLTPARVITLPLPPVENAHAWTVAQVGRWLHEHGFDAYIESFLDNQIDGEALENLELESLKELGLRLVGERVKFLAAVKKLFKPPGPTAPPPQISVSAVPREDGYNSDAGDSIGGGQQDEAHLSVATGAAGGGGKSSTLKKIRESFRKSVDPGKQAELQRALTILQTNRQTSSPTNSTKKKSRFGSFRDSSSNNNNAVVVSHVRQSSNTSISSNTSAGSPIIGDNTSGMTKSTSSTNIRSQLQGPQLSAPNITVDDIKNPAFAGWLMKQGSSTPKSWKRRWVVINGPVLYYFKSEKGSKAKGTIMLPSYTLWLAGEVRKRFAFKLQHVSARTYYFHAETYDQMKTWMNFIDAAVRSCEPTQISELPAVSFGNTETI